MVHYVDRSSVATRRGDAVDRVQDASRVRGVFLLVVLCMMPGHQWRRDSPGVSRSCPRSDLFLAGPRNLGEIPRLGLALDLLPLVTARLVSSAFEGSCVDLTLVR